PVIGAPFWATMQDPLDQGPEIVCLRFSRGAACCARTFSLPPVMRERPVGFRHLVCVFLLLYRLALALRCQDQLGGEALGHRLLFAQPAVQNQPAHRQRGAALGPHFHRHLIRGAADPPRFHLQRRLHVRERLLEHVHAGLSRALLDHVHRLIEDPLRQRLLAALHQVVEKLRDRLTVIPRISGYWAPNGGFSAAHFPASLGRFAPYLDRDCLRSFTPAASSVRRLMRYRPPARSFTRPPLIIPLECSFRLC